MEFPVFDAALVSRYDRSGPRYTSYPTAVQFHTGFSEKQYREHIARANNAPLARPLSLYVHLPFCERLCFYCACNKIVTKNRARAAPYLARLQCEIALQAALFERERQVDQLHFGGGTPTFLNDEELCVLMHTLRTHFTLRDDDGGEYGIEVDPREVRPETLAVLRALGFNRLSIGVQDFEPRVQQAVNRIQSEAQTFTVLAEARALGFRSINMDLIYGLPHQTVASFRRTLEKIISAAPDRLSIFNYAHLPGMFKPQRRIDEQDLPSAAEKLDILQTTIEQLNRAGYVYIGMDHFAHPDDELAEAQRNGTLYRNFQGYATHADCDLIGLGITSIGNIGDSFSQNARTLEDYYARIDAGFLPILRGVVLDADDRLRRDVIMQLICQFVLYTGAVERVYGINFAEYFASELEALTVMAADGLVALTPGRIEVLPVGRLLVRNVCMVFDRYLHTANNQRYSKLI